MKLYKKLIIENQNNQENLLKIAEAVSAAIDRMIKYAEVAISETTITNEGFLRFIYAMPDGSTTSESPANELHDEQELQAIFDEEFTEIINSEYPELK